MIPANAHVLKSRFRPIAPVFLPYKERQKYMHSFDLSDPVMAPGYEDYLPVVTSLCAAAGAVSGIAHMTVDEKMVTAGMSQRRPKPHVDGCFMPSRNRWGGGGWNHYCNDIGIGGYKRMSVIVASSFPGCRAWNGDFSGAPKDDGDLSQLVLGKGEVLPAGIGYLLSPDCIHESMIMDKDVKRTFLRIALPVEFEYVETA